MINPLFKLSESRGKEAAGIAIKNDRSIDIFKSPVKGSCLLKSSKYNKLIEDLYKPENCETQSSHFSIIGHSRLVTHGKEALSFNNQPVIKGNAVCIHNGIIVNDHFLWKKFNALRREFGVDTEIFLSLLQLFYEETGSISAATAKTFEQIEGSASVAVMFNNRCSLLLATNTGSLYTCSNAFSGILVFASEKYILQQFVNHVKKIGFFDPACIRQVKPGTGVLVDLQTIKQSKIVFADEEFGDIDIPVSYHPQVQIIDHSCALEAKSSSVIPPLSKKFALIPEVKKAMDATWRNLYSKVQLKRCTKCLLPETMTYICFDKHGVCNYCRNYKKIRIKGEDALKKIVEKYRRNDGEPDCIVAFSGGRDSSYGLHYVKNILGMNPVAYTYDWGMLTDLGRRNQARLCGKMGIENIIISADIRKKRLNIRKNIEAWLKSPMLGMIPLLMAGDKQLMHKAELLKKKMNIKLLIYSYGNGLEDGFFKIGFSGIRMNSIMPHQQIPVKDKMKLAAYYAGQYFLNPLYVNKSLFDTLYAFYSIFVLSDPNVHLFNYIRWDENVILSTIIDNYGWEIEADTCATWRIDDGTASFYNYIYMTVAGFTEFDTFRSVQIREGQLSRSEAYKLIKEENRPRYESIEWYADTIGFDCNRAIKIINKMQKLYIVPLPYI